MRLFRFYSDLSLVEGQLATLSEEAAHHLCQVLRVRAGTSIIVFNGQGGEYRARLVNCSKRNAQIQIEEFCPIERESPLFLTLVQAISRPEHMDYTIQKAVELGVRTIVPILTQRSAPLAENRYAKREQHWQKIIIAACEQCGRNSLPQLHPIISLSHWLEQAQSGSCLVLSPTAQESLPRLTNLHEEMTLLVGAEGGFDDEEITQILQASYTEVHLGPRILRTETAAITALAICQSMWGDLA